MADHSESSTLDLPRRPGGYRRDDVEALVRRLEGALADLEARAAGVRARVAELEGVNAEQRAREYRLRDILLEAQHEARELQERGDAERDEILVRAHRAAAERRVELENERVSLRSSLGELEAFERTLRLRCRFLFEQALGEMPSEPAAIPARDDPGLARWNGSAGRTIVDPALVATAAAEVEHPGSESTEELEIPEEEPTTEESALASAGAAEGTVPAELPPELEALEPEPPAPSPGAEPGPLTPDGEDRIRVLSRPEPPGPTDPSQAAAARPPRRRGLLVALAMVFALGGIGAAVAVLLTGDDKPTPAAAVDPDAAAEGVATTDAAGGGAPTTAGEPGTTAGSTGDGQPGEEPAGTAPETVEEEPAQPEPAAPAPITLSLSATGGDCWLEVRRGSATGPILFQGFLLQGESQTFEGKTLWVRMGQPTSLTVEVDGKTPKGLPEGTADVLFTADGVEVVGLG